MNASNPIPTWLFVELQLLIVLAVACLALCLFLALKLRRMGRSLNAIQKKQDETPRFVWSALNLYRQLPPEIVPSNWNSWSMQPDMLMLIVAEIVKNRPMKVVEFGSGVSTTVISSLIKSYGGRLISIEHDADYARKQRETLQINGLQEYVDMRVSPIGNKMSGPFSLPWYVIDDFENLANADLVIVDGPPKSLGPEVRFPGVDLMIDRLAVGGKIFMDDADRPGERRILDQIKKTHQGVVVETPPTVRGCFIISKAGQ